MTGAEHSGRAAARRRRIIRLRRTIAVTTILLLGGAYTAMIASAELPALEADLSPEAAQEITAETEAAEAAVEEQQEPTAIGWLHDDAVWANSDKAAPIASLTKLVTALVCLEAAPAEDDGATPVYTVGADHAAITQQVIARNGVLLPAPEGLELTTRQVVELLLVPSANNYAIAYGNWVFGDEQGFVDAVDDWAERNGIESLSITEASGLSPENVASPADVVRIARLALEHPLIADVVTEASVEIPGVGTIESTNPLLGEDGVIGLKTGTLDAAGYNLAVARHETEGDRELTTVAVVLDRDDGGERAADARATLSAADDTTGPVEVISAAETIGSVITWTGREVPLETSAEITQVLVPGETVSLRTDIAPITASPRGTEVGTALAEGPDGDDEVTVVTTGGIEEPDLWWRLTHPAIVFGWADPVAAQP